MPVAVRNEKASDTSRIWLIVSRVAAAVLGGYVVTYWTGAAVAKMAMEWDLLSRANAGMFSGLVQLVVYVALIIWVCAMASMRKAWLVLAVLTALLVGVTELTPGPPPHRKRRGAFRRQDHGEELHAAHGVGCTPGLVWSSVGWHSRSFSPEPSLSSGSRFSIGRSRSCTGRRCCRPAATVQYSVDYLQKVAPDSRRWSVYPAGLRTPSAPGVELARRERRAAVRAARARRLGAQGHHRDQWRALLRRLPLDVQP